MLLCEGIVSLAMPCLIYKYFSILHSLLTLPGKKQCKEELFTGWLMMLIFFRILWKKNEVADYEATTFSIFYNNALYLVLLIVVSFYLLKNFNPNVYPL